LNIVVVRALEKQLEHDIQVPKDPEIVGALGAAILANNLA
jgi:activator of 2-hydroxyglutaryl-CoA dehydratase